MTDLPPKLTLPREGEEEALSLGQQLTEDNKSKLDTLFPTRIYRHVTTGPHHPVS